MVNKTHAYFERKSRILEYDPKNKGPLFKFGGMVDVQVRHLMKCAADLEPLARALPDLNDEKAMKK